MVRFIAVAVAALAPMVAASSTTAVTKMVQYLIPADRQDYVGSVVAIKENITTMAVQCNPAASLDFCSLGGGNGEPATIIQGPSTWAFSYSHSNAEDGLLSQDFHCSLQPASNRLTCTATITKVPVNAQATTSTTTTTNTNYKESYLPVKVTGGADLISATGLPSAASIPKANIALLIGAVSIGAVAFV